MLTGLYTRMVARAFDRWSASYDEDARWMIRKRGYSYPWLAAEVLSQLACGERGHVLEIGTGPGTLGIEIRRHNGHVMLGIDISRRMTALAARTNAYDWLGQGTAEQLPFGSNSFDGAYSSFVWHSILRQEAAFSELFRVLKPGGRAVLVDLCPVGRGRWRSLLMGLCHSVRREFGAPARYAPIERFTSMATATGFQIRMVRRLGRVRRYSHFFLVLEKPKGEARCHHQTMLFCGVSGRGLTGMPPTPILK